MRLDTTDATYSFAVLAYWGAVEVNLPIICACLTTIRPLLNKLLPWLLGPRTSEYRETSSFAVPSRWRYAPGESTTAGERRGPEGGERSASEESLSFILHEVEGRGWLEAPARAYGGSVKSGAYV